MATTAQKKKNERMNKAMQLHQTYRSQMAVTGQKENDDVINSFLRDSQNYIRESDSSLRRMSWKDANDPDKQNVRKTVSNNMLQRAAQVKTILDGSRSSINPDQYKTLTDYLAAFEDDISAIGKETENVRNFYSKWKSEEEYNADYRRYIEQQRDRAEKSKFDLDAGQKEIDAQEAELAQLRTGNNIKAFSANSRPYAAGQTVADDAQYTTGYGITNNRPYAAGLQVQRENSPVDNRIRELEQQISQKKQYRNQAKQIQQSDAYADTVNNKDFDKYDDYVESDDDLHNWINDPQFRESYEARFQSVPNPNARRSKFVRKGYDRMNKSEIAIYNYYYAKGGKEAAQKYLDNIQETLNTRVAEEMYGQIDGNTAAELVFGISVGVNQFGTNAVNNFRFKSDYIPQSAHQIASGMVREDLGEIGKQRKLLGGNTLAQVAYDAVTTGANMAPSILVSVATGVPIAGTAMMGLSAAGGAYQQALNEGFDKSQARGYSIMVGASEMVMEKLLGGISAVGGNALGINAVKNIANADTALKAIAKRIGSSMLSEFGEEYLQEILDPVFRNIMLKTGDEVKLISAEAIYSGILGALTGAFMEAPFAIYGEAQTASTGRKLKEAGSVNDLTKIGNTFAPETVAYKLAGKVTSETGAYTIGQLFNEVNAKLTEQNISEIAEVLAKEGVGENTARQYAEAFAYVVEGWTLPNALADAIEADTKLANAARQVLFEDNTTWNQRSQGYRDILRKLAEDKVKGKTAPASKASATTDNTAEVKAESGAEGNVEPVKYGSIQTIKNGKVTVKMTDGSEVDLKDADLDPEDSVRIETITSIDGISAEDASGIFNILKAGSKNSQYDAIGAREAYRYGYYGLTEKMLDENGTFSKSLTPEQRKAVYEMGQKARQQNVETTTFRKTDAKKAPGKVHYDGDRTVLNERQQVSLKAMDRIASALGVQIYIFESKVGKSGKRIGENGWYDPKDGSIHIDLYSGQDGGATMLFTLAHELTHYIRQWSPQKFKILADFLMEEYGKNGVNVSKLIREQKRKAKRNGRTISYDTAYEEVVADSMEMMLSDGNVMKRLEKLKAQDKDLWSQIKRFIDDMAAKIRAVYKDMKPDSKEAEFVMEMGDTIYRLQELFTEGLVEASENFQSAEKNTTEDGGVKNSIRDKFYEQVNNWDGRTIGFSFVVGETSNALQEAGIPQKQIRWDASEIATLLKKHNGMNLETVKQIPELLENPIIVIDSKKGDNSKIVMGDLYDEHGKIVTAVLLLTPTSKKGNMLDFYKISSAEGRSHIKSLFTKEDGSPVAVRYVDKKRIQSWLNVNRLQLPLHNLDSDSKFSIRDDAAKVNEKTAESVDISFDEASESVAPSVLYSERTWTESDYVQERDLAAKEIAKAIGVTEKKAKDYIDSVNSIAKMIADDRTRLDYFSSPNRSSFVSNVEYGGSFDFSTLCKKRRLLTGTFTAIQKALPNTALTANEILDIRNRMKDAGLEVSCGLCYVEGSRANMGQFAKEFLRLYKQYYPDEWQPNMADVNTPDGIEWVRINHPECYEQYEYFWNHYGTLKAGDKNLFASQQKPKLYQLHTEYKGEILKKFKDDDNVEEKNLNGGIRLQSFSDFEIVHLIDTMQIIMDMSRVGLAGQAYTKVPDFAWALGDTGLKINLSLIAKGVDENGKLIFDDVEGMPIADAMKLRDRYSANVGTILVAFNDEQLKAAMADDRVDFIIPFHRSQWKKSQYSAMGLPAKTKDYTFMQNEKFIKPQYHEYRGRMVKDKATNYMPNEYWDFSKSGKENAEAYLEMCARNNKRPKFYKLLENNGDGSYSLKADGSTDGYWKLLIDFKMYDNAGNGSPQQAVRPEFNMEEATRMLNEYSGGHSNFPVAQGIVDEFVSEYKDSHEGVQYSDRDFPSNAEDIAKEYFGTTKKWSETGWLLRDGTQLDFSGRHWERDPENEIDLGEYYYSGKRNMEHYEIAEAFPELREFSRMEYRGEHLDRFQNRGNIRIVGKGIAAIEKMPTEEQFKKLHSYFRENIDKGIIVGIGRDDMNFNAGTNPSVIVEGIRDYFSRNRRNQSELMRFHTMFSDRDTESVTARSLLASTDVATIKNEVARKKLTDYQKTLEAMNAEDQKLREIRAEIKELSFAKAPKDTKKLKDLKFEAIKINNHISVYEGQLQRMEKELQSVVKRERDKVVKEAEKRDKAVLAKEWMDAQVKQSETLREYRETRAALRQQESDTAVMEKEFVRIVKEFEKLEQKSGKTISDLRKKLKNEAKSHRADEKMWMAEFGRLMREYDAADRKIEKLEQKIERQKNVAKERVENRNKTAMRHKIQNVVKELNSLLLTNDKKRHVPDNLKKAVAAALDLVNMDTTDAENRAAKYADLIAKEQAKANPDQDKIDAYTVTMENILRKGEKMADRIKELHAAYEEIKSSEDPDIANAYDPVISGAIQELAGTIGNTSIKNMTMEQLSDVYDVCSMVLIRVRDANKAMAENIRASIEELAKATIREVQAAGGSNKYRISALDPVRKFDWDNLKPVYAMERIGSSTLTEVFNNVRAGEDTWAKDVSEARAYYLEKSKKYGYDKWDFDKKYRFESNSGIPFELTLEQILSLYAYSKREQAADHLRLGGFVFDSNIETYKEKDGKKSILKYKVNTADAHQITPEIMADIIGNLSKEQSMFVDEMQDYLSTVMGAKGNEVTSKMYGVKLFKEKFYFPLKSAKQFMFEQNEVSGEVRIKNSGFTNKVVAKANNPVILSNFMDVWSGHVNDMSMYHAFTLPLEDFNRVFNYNTPKENGIDPVSVKGTIQTAYSPAAVSYVKQLITDLNGGARTDPRTGFINKATALHKKGAVLASLSVVIQQPSAIARATALIDLKYFDGYSAGTLPKVALDFAKQSLHDVFNLKKETNHDKEWAELKKYAPVSIIKEMGYFDANMGKSTRDYITGKEYSGFKEKVKATVTDSAYRDELLSKAPSLADEVAWCAIWRAVKRETFHRHNNLRPSSDALLKLAGERFTEVITKTQVYDSVLARSANMRSKDTGMNMAAAFMAEPTTAINMLLDAHWKGKRGNKIHRVRTNAAVLSSIILNSILVSIVYAGRDDDEDETYAEKYLGALTRALIDGINPAMYFPFIKDIWSIIQGYDVERSDMALANDLLKAWKKLSREDVSPYQKAQDFAGTAAMLLGFPLKNIMRDFRWIWQMLVDPILGNDSETEKTTLAGIKYAQHHGRTGKDIPDKEQLYKARLDGDKQHAARVAARYEDEDSADAAVKSAIKDRFIEGEIDEATALKHMIQFAGMDADEAHWTMDAWKYRLEKGSEDEYAKYDKFYDAVRSGENLQSVVKSYTDYGVKTSTLTGQITEEFKPLYLEASRSEKSSMKSKLINAYVACGMEREKAAENLDDWDFESEYGFSYSKRKQAFLDGDVSREKLIRILMDHGYTNEDARAQIEVYEWEGRGIEDATVAAVREYNEYCALLNVPKDIYLHIRKFSNDTENDVDPETGKSINHSAMKKVMAEINAQRLTAEQKTAIARSLGWSEKNIQKYKLW